MKVTKTETDGFKPFTLAIEVTTQAEADAIRTLFGMDVTIPHVVREDSDLGSVGENILANLFNKVYHVL